MPNRPLFDNRIIEMMIVHQTAIPDRAVQHFISGRYPTSDWQAFLSFWRICSRRFSQSWLVYRRVQNLHSKRAPNINGECGLAG